MTAVVETYTNGDQPTSGHSGTDTSQATASTRAALQPKVIAVLAFAGRDGSTVAQLRRLLPGAHHGSISSALTNLHRSGDLARLSTVRGGCKVYVLTGYIDGRTTETPSTSKDAARTRYQAMVEAINAMEISTVTDEAEWEQALQDLLAFSSTYFETASVNW